MGVGCSSPCCGKGTNPAHEIFDDGPQPEDQDTDPDHLPRVPFHFRPSHVADDVSEANSAEPIEPALKHGKSFHEVNARSDSDMRKELETRKFSRSLSKTQSKQIDDSQMQAMDVDDVLDEVENLVDVSYDVLMAEVVLAHLEERLGSKSEEWERILALPLFERFKRKLEYHKSVGQAIGKDMDSWFSVYQDPTKTQTIHGLLDKTDKNCLHYRVQVHIPTSLTNVMAVGNEVELLPTWNNLVVSEPQILGRRTAHYMVLNYQMSFLGGMYKVDNLNEIRRFSDVEGGYLAEYIESVSKEHPCHREAKPGFKRPKVLLKNVWVANGPEHTTLLQVGMVVLPFTATKWLASSIGSVAGRFIVNGLVKNSLRAAQPKNPWEKALKQDLYGLYARMAECVEGAGSHERACRGKHDSKLAAEMTQRFNHRRIKRTSL